MIAKAHIANERKLVAVCDEDILGKKFEENELQIDLTGDYFRGEKVTEEELEKILKGALAINFAGKKSVEFGLKKGLVKKEGIVRVAGVPHAQVFSAD